MLKHNTVKVSEVFNFNKKKLQLQVFKWNYYTLKEKMK